MFRPLIGIDERFQEVLVLVLNHGIQFDGWARLASGGIRLVGYRVVGVIVDPKEPQRPDPPARPERII